jgi:uncharacterized Ntn-hydrolase superfamily protein
LTFSIVAKDEQTGAFGVAVQSHWFSVGSIVSWGRAGVGAVATQAMVEVSYGPLGLELMSSGKSAGEALAALLESDSRANTRQVAMVDAQGNVAVHTGEKCIPFAGHVRGKHFTCEANLMRNDTIWGAMAKSYENTSGKRRNSDHNRRRGEPKNSKLEFPEKLLEALEAGEAAGGDVRGKQSAALLIVGPNVEKNSWSGRLIDLRVEDHPDPIPELKRLLRLHRGYEWANKGDDLLTTNDFEGSLKAYEKAGEFAPDLEELQFWQGVSLVYAKRMKEAKLIFKEVFKKNKDWIQVLNSLPQLGLLPSDPKIIEQIL